MNPPYASPLTAPEADLSAYAGAVQHVLVAFTPRTGSTVLANSLGRTGRCGVPHEYLNPIHLADFRRRLGPMSTPALWNWFRRHRTTDNGVFCFKAAPEQIQLELVARGIRPRSLMVPVRAVWVRRRDKVRQAVSYARAVQTQQWNAKAVEQHAPVYNYGLLERCFRFVLVQEGLWPVLFRELGVSPLTVWYRQILEHHEATVRGLVGGLGLGDPMQASVGAPSSKRVPSPEAQEWCGQFRQEAMQNGISAALFGPEEPWV